MPTLRLDAADPLARTTEALNNFKPDSLVGYASILRSLADEQLAGRLAIAPRAVMSASEVLTDETRARIHGRPFALLEAIEGREEDVLHLNGMAIHPNVFHSALEPVPVAGWQVVEEPDGLLVLLAQPTEGVVDAGVATGVRAALQQAGADNVRVRVERVDTIPRTALGKAPLVRALRRERDDALLSPAPAAFSTLDVR